MDLQELENIFYKYFTYNNVLKKDIYKTISISCKEAKKGATKLIHVDRYDISSQELVKQEKNTLLGNLIIVKSNGGEIKIADRTLKVDIPKNIIDGQVFKMKGQGNIENKERGDLYIRIDVKKLRGF